MGNQPEPVQDINRLFSMMRVLAGRDKGITGSDKAIKQAKVMIILIH
jgi:hypothetical protein